MPKEDDYINTEARESLLEMEGPVCITLNEPDSLNEHTDNSFKD